MNNAGIYRSHRQIDNVQVMTAINIMCYVELGEPVSGYGSGTILASKNKAFKVGSLVVGPLGTNSFPLLNHHNGS